jgi:hypothetical protein
MAFKKTLLGLLLSCTCVTGYPDDRQDYYKSLAENYEAIALINEEAIKLADNRIMNIDQASQSPKAPLRANQKAQSTERIANLYNGMHTDYMEMYNNLITASGLYKQADKQDLSDKIRKKAESSRSLASIKLEQAAKAYSEASLYHEENNDTEKAILTKRKEGEIEKKIADSKSRPK